MVVVVVRRPGVHRQPWPKIACSWQYRSLTETSDGCVVREPVAAVVSPVFLPRYRFQLVHRPLLSPGRLSLRLEAAPPTDLRQPWVRLSV